MKSRIANRFLMTAIMALMLCAVLAVSSLAAIGLTEDGFLAGLTIGKSYTAAPYDIIAGTTGTAQSVDKTTDFDTLGSGIWAISDGTTTEYVFVEGTESAQLSYWDTANSTVLSGLAGSKNEKGLYTGKWTRGNSGSHKPTGDTITIDENGVTFVLGTLATQKTGLAKTELLYGLTNAQVIPANALESWNFSVALPTSYATGYSKSDLSGTVTFYVKNPGDTEATEYTVTLAGIDTGEVSINAPAALANSTGYIVGVGIQPWANWSVASTTMYSSASLPATIVLNKGVNALNYTLNYATPDVAVTGVTLNNETLALTIGDMAELVATVAPDNATTKDISWDSDNDDVATVVNGKVTAIATGTANIIVTTLDGGKTDTCAVTVSAMQPIEVPTGLSAGNGTIAGLVDGEYYQYANVVMNSAGTALEYTTPAALTANTEVCGLVVVRSTNASSTNFSDWTAPIYVAGTGVANIIHTTAGTDKNGNPKNFIDVTSGGSWTSAVVPVYNEAKWTGSSLTNELAKTYGFDPLRLGTTSGQGTFSYMKDKTGDDLVAAQAQAKAHLDSVYYSYMYKADEIVPMSRFESFKFQALVRQGAQTVSSALYTKFTFKVVTEDGQLVDRVVKKAAGKFAATTHTITLADFADTTGYIVGILIQPYTTEDASIIAYANNTMVDLNVQLYSDSYKINLPKADKPTGLTIENGVVKGLDPEKVYAYAPMYITGPSDTFTTLPAGSTQLEGVTGLIAVMIAGDGATTNNSDPVIFYVPGPSAERANLGQVATDRPAFASNQNWKAGTWTGSYLSWHDQTTGAYSFLDQSAGVDPVMARTLWLYQVTKEQAQAKLDADKAQTSVPSSWTTNKITSKPDVMQAAIDSHYAAADYADTLAANKLAHQQTMADKLEERFIQYAYDETEVIPVNELIEMSFTQKSRQTQITFNASAKVVFFVMDSEGALTEYSYVGPKTEIKNGVWNKTTVDVQSIENWPSTGWVVGVRYYPVAEVEAESIVATDPIRTDASVVAYSFTQHHIAAGYYYEPFTSYVIMTDAVAPEFAVTANPEGNGYDITITNATAACNYEYKKSDAASWTALEAGVSKFTVSEVGTYTVKVSGELLLGEAQADCVVDKITPVAPTLEYAVNSTTDFKVTLTDAVAPYVYEYKAEADEIWTTITDGSFIVAATGKYTVRAGGDVYNGYATADVTVELQTPVAPTLSYAINSATDFKVTLTDAVAPYVYEYKAEADEIWTTITDGSFIVAATGKYTVRAGGDVYNGYATADVTVELQTPVAPKVSVVPGDTDFTINIKNFSDLYTYEYKLNDATEWTPVTAGAKSFVITAGGEYTVRAGGAVFNGYAETGFKAVEVPQAVKAIEFDGTTISGLDASLAYEYANVNYLGINDNWTAIPAGTEFTFTDPGLYIVRLAAAGTEEPSTGLVFNVLGKIADRGTIINTEVKNYANGTNWDKNITTAEVLKWAKFTDKNDPQFTVGRWSSWQAGDLYYWSKSWQYSIGSTSYVSHGSLGAKILDGSMSQEEAKQHIEAYVFKYAYEDAEIIPLADLEKFTIQTGGRQGHLYVQGDVYTRFVFHIANNYGEVETRELLLPAKYADPYAKNTHTIKATDFEDTDGYIVAIDVYPFGEIADNAEVKVTGTTGNDYEATPKEYQVKLPRIDAPTTLVFNEKTQLVEGFNVDAEYYYAPYTVNGVGEKKYHTGETLALETGLWGIGLVSEDPEFADSLPFLVFVRGDEEARMTLGTFGDNGYFVVKGGTDFIQGTWTGPSIGTHSTFETNGLSTLGGHVTGNPYAKDLKAAIDAGDAAAEAAARQAIVDVADTVLFRYAYANDEVIPSSELLNFKFTLKKRMGSLNLGAGVTAKIIFYVINADGSVGQYVVEEATSTASQTSHDIDVQSIEGWPMDGYVVAVDIYPWTKVVPENVVVLDTNYYNTMAQFNLTEYIIKTNPGAPKVIPFDAPDIEGGYGEFANLEADKVYSFRADGSDEWTDIPAGSTSYSPVAPGTYYIKVKASRLYTESDEVMVIVGKVEGALRSLQNETKKIHLPNDFIEVKSDYEIDVTSKIWISRLALDNIKAVSPESTITIVGENFKYVVVAANLETEKAVHYYNLDLSFDGESRHDTSYDELRELSGDAYITEFFTESVNDLPFSEAELYIKVGSSYDGQEVELRTFNERIGKLRKTESATVEDGWVMFTNYGETYVILSTEE